MTAKRKSPVGELEDTLKKKKKNLPRKQTMKEKPK